MAQSPSSAEHLRAGRRARPGKGEPLRIALAGLGTVGVGVIRLIETNGALIARRAGRPIVVSVVSARDRDKDRGVDISGYGWEDDMTGMAARDDVDVVVELVGGADGPALTLARHALRGGKALVTANKAMIAHHGLELAALAEASGAPLRFEAAVAGGVPVIKGLREGAAANAIDRVYGILNGTCNFILSTMEDTGRDFADVLAEAQAKGYAEADPAFDIEGTDTAHKLSILSALAFGTRIDFATVETSGISRILSADIAQADALGYVIRLIGMAEIDFAGDGNQPDAPPGLFQRVQAHLVPFDHPLAHVDGATNAMVVEGNFSGRLLFQGAGAGDGPTASAVVADIIDIARGIEAGFEADMPFSVPVGSLEAMAPAVSGHRRSRAYIRFIVADRPGVLAEITAAMRDAGVSIESLIQKGRADNEGEVLVAMVTHEAPEAAVTKALELLDGSPSLIAQPLVMHLLGK
jgi:homoserine dehydrogenase